MESRNKSFNIWKKQKYFIIIGDYFNDFSLIGQTPLLCNKCITHDLYHWFSFGDSHLWNIWA